MKATGDPGRQTDQRPAERPPADQPEQAGPTGDLVSRAEIDANNSAAAAISVTRGRMRFRRMCR